MSKPAPDAAPSRFGPRPRVVLRDLLELDYALAERSFEHFFRAAWAVLEPATPLLYNWHVGCIAEHLQATYSGELRHLIINVPPRSLKSLVVTVCFPAWCWLKNPSLRFINASYSEDLATKHSVDRRLLLMSDWFQAAWGDRFAFSADQNQKTEYTNDKRGHCVAAGMLGTVTGKGGDFVMVDDPHNPKKAESEAERTAAVDAFDSTFTSRLDNKKTGRFIVVMQRLHEKDLTGHLLAKHKGDPEWTHLKLPAEAPKRTVVHFPLSGKTVVREAGDILHPQREGKVELAAAKVALGSYNYAGQYDQSPAPRTGGLFKRSFWRWYKGAPPKLDRVIQSWDLAFKGLDTSDFVAGLVIGCAGADRYVLDCTYEQMGFRASKNAVRNLRAKWPTALTTLIEDKANGPALVDDLKSEIGGLLAVGVEGSKWERACLCEPELESGNVYLPSDAPWAKKLVDQCAVFPRGDHDDLVDAFTQGLNWLRGKAFNRTTALGNL